MSRGSVSSMRESMGRRASDAKLHFRDIHSKVSRRRSSTTTPPKASNKWPQHAYYLEQMLRTKLERYVRAKKTKRAPDAPQTHPSVVADTSSPRRSNPRR